MNERNVRQLYDWLRCNKVAMAPGIWAGIEKNSTPAPELFRPGDSPKKFKYWSVFASGILSGLPDLAPVEDDFVTWSTETYLSWVRYIKRVYDLNMEEPEYQYADSFKWRDTVGGNWKASVLRLRFVLDNHGLITRGEVEQLIDKAKACTYDDI